MISSTAKLAADAGEITFQAAAAVAPQKLETPGEFLKGDLSGITAKLGGAVYQNLPLPVVPPSSKEATGWSFRRAKNLQDAPTRLGVGAGQEGTTYRVEVTGYSANNVRRISRYTKSNRVYYIPFDKLSEQFIRIHREGGKISSITPVT